MIGYRSARGEVYDHRGDLIPEGDTGNVVRLDDERAARGFGWRVGTASCAWCESRWVAVAPASILLLRCPGCGFETGCFE